MNAVVGKHDRNEAIESNLGAVFITLAVIGHRRMRVNLPDNLEAEVIRNVYDAHHLFCRNEEAASCAARIHRHTSKQARMQSVRTSKEVGNTFHTASSGGSDGSINGLNDGWRGEASSVHRLGGHGYR